MKLKLPYPVKTVIDAPPMVERILRQAFPGYRGRKFRLDISLTERCNDTYWDGGTRSDYVFVNLETGQQVELPDYISGGYAPHAAAAYDRLACVELRENFAIVRHQIFCGHDLGLTLVIHPSNAAKLLPSATASSLTTSVLPQEATNV